MSSFFAPRLTRATSFNSTVGRTSCFWSWSAAADTSIPPTLTTMFSNSATSSSRPRVDRVRLNACPVGAGSSPIWPAATCLFCSLIAFTTSAAVRFRVFNSSGSSQTRML